MDRWKVHRILRNGTLEKSPDLLPVGESKYSPTDHPEVNSEELQVPQVDPGTSTGKPDGIPNGRPEGQPSAEGVLNIIISTPPAETSSAPEKSDEFDLCELFE